jgi:hypothetical protein
MQGVADDGWVGERKVIGSPHAPSKLSRADEHPAMWLRRGTEAAQRLQRSRPGPRLSRVAAAPTTRVRLSVCNCCNCCGAKALVLGFHMTLGDKEG